MDNKKLGLHLRKSRKALVQTVKVVLGSVSLLRSKTCGSKTFAEIYEAMHFLNQPVLPL